MLKMLLLGLGVVGLQLPTTVDVKPFAADVQIKMLKAQRDLQQQQIKIADLQRQFDQAANAIKQIQQQMEADCSAAARAASVDLTKYTCDLDQLAFVPKPPPEKPKGPDGKP